MLKQLLTSIALTSVTFIITPDTNATRPHEPHSYQRRLVHRHQPTQIKRYGYSHRLVLNRRHQRHRPHGVFVGIHLPLPSRPSYTHRHPLHAHDTYCPIIVCTSEHHHLYQVPTWEVDYYSNNERLPRTFLHIIVPSYLGKVYIDGRFVGTAETFNKGENRIPISPGYHTVGLRYRNQDFTRQIRIKAGNTTIVKAHFSHGQYNERSPN